MSRKQLVTRGLALIEPLRTRGYTVSVCPDCGAPAVEPPHWVQQLLEQIFDQPEAVQAAMAAFPNQALAWENAKPGDHDAPYDYGRVGKNGDPELLAPEERQRLNEFEAVWRARSVYDQPQVAE